MFQKSNWHRPRMFQKSKEARCAICMEHPHNAVLLRCSSSDKGCHPHMCNTSYRHSNCLDQFCKSSTPSPSTSTMQQFPGAIVNSHRARRTNFYTNSYEGESEDKLNCPLCRGEVHGWFVVEPANIFMNSKARSCSYENCDFIGNLRETEEAQGSTEQQQCQKHQGSR